MVLSTHKIEVVRVSPKDHPNAERLDLIEVYGYTCCSQKGNFKDGDLACYVPPDSVVSVDRPEFSFLKKDRPQERIKVKRLRGILSMGLLIPAPDFAKEGDDLAEYFGITRYEPPEPASTGGEAVGGPPLVYYKYDVDSIMRYKDLFQAGEAVYITEKIHGASARYVFTGGQMYCGSRTEWKKESDSNAWWRALRNDPEIGNFCESEPDLILYGEVYGPVQGFKYGKTKPTFAAFDILKNGNWLDSGEFLELCNRYGVPTVPVIHKEFPFNFEEIQKLANGPSLVPGANHVREGVVVKPIVERTSPEIGRVCLKCVGEDYYNAS